MGNNSSNQREPRIIPYPINAISTLVSDNVNGYVLFHQCHPTEHVSVKFEIKGPPNQTHAIHIHEFGDLRRGCESLGAHFNPTNQTHGSIFYEMPRHAGDLINNLKFDKDGIFVFEYKDPSISLYPSKQSIIGRSIVIHEKEDDLGLGKNKEESLKTGNAGKRICCAIIGLCEKEHF